MVTLKLQNIGQMYKSHRNQANSSLPIPTTYNKDVRLQLLKLNFEFVLLTLKYEHVICADFQKVWFLCIIVDFMTYIRH